MTEDLPPPMTPVECDLRDFHRMPIDIPRLRQSSFDAVISSDAWRAGFNLWFAAWHSVPAGSLDDNEAALTKAAGLGRDIRTWREVAPDALRGFVKCSDGRLYHDTVAEFALVSWIEKLRQRIVSGAGNARRWGAEFDKAGIEKQIADAAGMLAAIAPHQPYLSKLKRILSQRDGEGVPAGQDIPPGQEDVPDGTNCRSHRDANNVPSRSQGEGEGEGEGVGVGVDILGPSVPRYDDADVDDADDARAGAHARSLADMAAQVCKAAGVRNQSRHERGKNEAIVQRWLAEGYRLNDILAAIAEALQYARTPPQSLAYYENPVWQLANPAPRPDGPDADYDPSDQELGPDTDDPPFGSVNGAGRRSDHRQGGGR